MNRQLGEWFRRVLVVSVLLALGTSAACASNGSGQRAIVSPAGSCPPIAVDPGGLAAFEPSVPDGYLRLDHAMTGGFDLSRMVADRYESEDELVQLGYRRGYVWEWTLEPDAVLIANVFEFCDGRGSREFVVKGNDTKTEEELGRRFEVDGVDDAEGRAMLGLEPSYALSTSAVRGPFVLMAHSAGTLDKTSIQDAERHVSDVLAELVASVEEATK